MTFNNISDAIKLSSKIRSYFKSPKSIYSLLLIECSISNIDPIILHSNK